MTDGGHLVLLDLDGTLIDSAPGIVSGIARAYEAVDLDVPDEALMRSWIGPPVRETLTRELGSRGDDVMRRAVAAFRAYFDTQGAHESVVFPGVHDAMSEIAGAGSVMVVVTHKPAPLAELALAQHGLDAHVRGLYAPPSPSFAMSKERLFAQAIAAHAPTSAMAVGDRGEDIRAAAAHGISGVGVRWGYGNEHELVEAGAVALIADPADLPSAVAPPAGAAEA